MEFGSLEFAMRWTLTSSSETDLREYRQLKKVENVVIIADLHESQRRQKGA